MPVQALEDALHLLADLCRGSVIKPVSGRGATCLEMDLTVAARAEIAR